MKQRIAILQNGLIRGGTERFVINLCKGLDKEKYDITVINPSLRPEEQVLEPEVIDAGASILHTCTIVGIGGRLKHLWHLYRILRKGNYDVFHTNLDLFNGPNLMVAALAGVPLRICHAHASMQEAEIRKGRTLGIRVYQRLMRWMCWTFSNRRIGCSDEANDFLYKGHDWRSASYPTVIYNGIDLQKYKTPAETDYNFDPEKKYILAVGRFVPQKNPGFILDIMERLKETAPDIKLLWVGNGNLHKSVEAEISARALDNIDLLGWRDDVLALMQHTDLLLMPSLFEGLSITLIEAQAAGLRCLVSDTTTTQSQCGLIQYKPLKDGAKEWAETAVRMIEHKITLSLNQTALEKFSISEMANTVFDFHALHLRADGRTS